MAVSQHVLQISIIGDTVWLSVVFIKLHPYVIIILHVKVIIRFPIYTAWKDYIVLSNLFFV